MKLLVHLCISLVLKCTCLVLSGQQGRFAIDLGCVRYVVAAIYCHYTESMQCFVVWRQGNVNIHHCTICILHVHADTLHVQAYAVYEHAMIGLYAIAPADLMRTMQNMGHGCGFESLFPDFHCMA